MVSEPCYTGMGRQPFRFISCFAVHAVTQEAKGTASHLIYLNYKFYNKNNSIKPVIDTT
jgi:hypothetical protein